MKKLMTLSLVGIVAAAFCATTYAGWQLQYIRDSGAAPFVPGPANAWFVNWVSNYPVFYMRKQAQNGTLTLRVKGVTFERFSYYMNSDISALLKLTTAAADPPIKLEVKLSSYFLSAPPFQAPQLDFTWRGNHGAQPNIGIIVTTPGTMPTVSLGDINVYYGRPALSANNTMTFPANWFGYVSVNTDGGFKTLNVFGGIVRQVIAKSNLGAIYVRRVKHNASGIIYGGILGGAAGHATADIYTKGIIGYIFANGGLGSALRNGVPAAQEPTVCSGWDGAGAVYPNGIATIVAPSGGLNSQICAGSGPVTLVYGAAIRTILLGNQNAGVLTTSKFVAGPKPKIAGPGKALAVGSTVETNLGSIPINAAY